MEELALQVGASLSIAKSKLKTHAICPVALICEPLSLDQHCNHRRGGKFQILLSENWHHSAAKRRYLSHDTAILRSR